MKKIIVVFLCLFIVSGIKVFADDDYKENYGTFIGDTIEENLDEDTKQRLYSDNLSPDSPDWVQNLQAEGVFSYIISLFKGGIKRPIIAFVSITGVILLFAAFSAFGQEKYLKSAEIIAPGIIAVLTFADIYSCVTAAAEAIRAASSFMIGFVPALASLISASGGALYGATSCVTLLISANAVSTFAANGVLPLMGGYLSISMASGVSPAIAKVNPAAALKKVTIWVLSLVSTVFLGVLSVQTAVLSAGDNAAIKMAKFVLGTSVPVAGGVLSEAVSAISSSLSLLKSSVGIFAVVAIAAIILPVLIEIVLWRACFFVSAAFGTLFGEERISALLKAVDSVLACILGLLLLVGGLFIISLSVVVLAGKSV